MKKRLIIVITTLMVLLLTSCGGTSIESEANPSDLGKTETTEKKTEKNSEQEKIDEPLQESNSDIISANGLSVKIVDIHKTKDFEGHPILVAEFLFTNDNAEPTSFMWPISVTSFQNGIELTNEELVLEMANKDFDWDSEDKEIKDGATITVFHPIALQNETDSVEIIVEIINTDNLTVSASTTIEYNPDSDTESCSADDEKQAEKEDEQEDLTEAEDKEVDLSDTISANGYTVQIVNLHKTKDSNGEPMAAAEFLFTNKNEEPISFMGAISIIAFQNGIELTKDEMFLENDYDWDSYYTEIKDGATISVFHPIPLQNEKDPVELTVDIMDFENWTSEASTTKIFDLN